jgi:hypothetical protein
VHIPEIIDNAGFGEMISDIEKLSSVLDPANQRTINLAKIFTQLFNY